MLAMGAAMSMASDPVLVLGPTLTHQFAISIDWSEYFFSALGLGTMLGALMPDGPSDFSRTSRWAALSLLVLGVSIIIFTEGFSPWASPLP